LNIAQKKFKLNIIELDKNYRFASNQNMLLLDKIIRQNAVTPFKNPSTLKSDIEFKIYENQASESLEVIRKSVALIQANPDSHVAIIVKQRGRNVDNIIDTFNHNKIPFFYGLFTDDDSNYITFNRKCLHEFIELIRIQSRISKKISKLHIDKISELYVTDNTPLIKALFELLKVFWFRLFSDYSFLSNEDKINFIKDTFEHNGLKQFMEFLDVNIIVSTVHAAKGLEWDFVILPDMEQDLFPNWFGLCGNCKSKSDCNLIIDTSNEAKFLEELSVFYVAVTRAKKQVFFSASKTQLTNFGTREKNVSCFMKLPGINMN
jgi:DNA helicase-2/ATP-dependent DNA helicase PcrA